MGGNEKDLSNVDSILVAENTVSATKKVTEFEEQKIRIDFQNLQFLVRIAPTKVTIKKLEQRKSRQKCC